MADDNVVREIHMFSNRHAREYPLQEGCDITEWSNSDLDPGLSIARARVAPGVTTRWHSLRGVSERYVILSGRGRVEVGAGKPQAVGPGDVVLIPPETRQRVTNTGTGDLVFLAVCSPRYTPDCYRDLDADTAST